MILGENLASPCIVTSKRPLRSPPLLGAALFLRGCGSRGHLSESGEKCTRMSPPTEPQEYEVPSQSGPQRTFWPAHTPTVVCGVTFSCGRLVQPPFLLDLLAGPGPRVLLEIGEPRPASFGAGCPQVVSAGLFAAQPAQRSPVAARPRLSWPSPPGPCRSWPVARAVATGQIGRDLDSPVRPEPVRPPGMRRSARGPGGGAGTPCPPTCTIVGQCRPSQPAGPEVRPHDSDGAPMRSPLGPTRGAPRGSVAAQPIRPAERPGCA
jgi:hypothetical protein